MAKKREYLDDCPDCRREREEEKKLGKLRAEVARLREQNAALVKALAKATELLDQDNAELGGCDHSVGICMCEQIRAVEDARAVIAKAEAANV